MSPVPRRAPPNPPPSYYARCPRCGRFAWVVRTLGNELVPHRTKDPDPKMCLGARATGQLLGPADRIVETP